MTNLNIVPTRRRTLSKNGSPALALRSPSPYIDKVRSRPTNELHPYSRNARRHSDKQLTQIAASIRQFGFVNPILIDAAGHVIAGHGRLLAAQRLGMQEVPTLEVAHLSPDEIKAYRIADNRLAELSDWDDALLALELGDLSCADINFELEITGFSTAEIDLRLDEAPSVESADLLDEIPVATIAQPPTGARQSSCPVVLPHGGMLPKLSCRFLSFAE